MLVQFKEKYKRLSKWYEMSDDYSKTQNARKEDGNLVELFESLSERDKCQAVLDLEVNKMEGLYVDHHQVAKAMNDYRINRELITLSV